MTPVTATKEIFSPLSSLQRGNRSPGAWLHTVAPWLLTVAKISLTPETDSIFHSLLEHPSVGQHLPNQNNAENFQIGASNIFSEIFNVRKINFSYCDKTS